LVSYISSVISIRNKSVNFNLLFINDFFYFFTNSFYYINNGIFGYTYIFINLVKSNVIRERDRDIKTTAVIKIFRFIKNNINLISIFNKAFYEN